MLLTEIWETCLTDQRHETIADWSIQVVKRTWPL